MKKIHVMKEKKNTTGQNLLANGDVKSKISNDTFYTIKQYHIVLFAILSISLLSSVQSFAQKYITESDSISDFVEKIQNIPNIEVGKGVSFQPANKSYKMTMRFRMQNMAAMNFDEDFSLSETQAQVKRLRLRFDGYIYSSKLTYSLQLGFTPYDTKALPNGNTNIVRDAMVYYIPNSTWNIGLGQTKIRANRARINSSSALQFVDRSIVNSKFNIDRDFGLFGEYYKTLKNNFSIAAKGSITLGEGRNWTASKNSGLCYTGRLELFPLGRFKSLGDIIEGDFEREHTPKILLAASYSFNDRALRIGGTTDAMLPEGETRDIKAYFIDFIFKYSGFSFYSDLMGRVCSQPLFDKSDELYIYTGKGLNLQTSYLFPKNWEIALRNSTLYPSDKIKENVGYDAYNQSTIGVTRYLIGHSLKMQADASYNYRSNSVSSNYNRWEFRVQIELGL